MKKSILFTLLFAFSLGFVFSQPLFEKGSAYCSYRKSQMKNLPKSPGCSPNAPKHSFDVLNYELYLDIFDCYQSPYSHYFKASNEITFRVDTALSQIRLNAGSASMQIDSVSAPCTSFTHANDILTINFGQTYNPGDEVTVKIHYTHLNVENGGFYASGGMVFTDAEPEGAREWFPCWDRPADKATLDLTARVPTSVKLGSNGRLQDSTMVGNAILYHWVSRDPIATYLMVMSSKVNYNLDIVYWQNPNDPNEVVPIRFYYNNGENPGPMEDMIGPLTTYFSEHYGDHPFEKNGFAALNNEFSWGGMENQTLTSICPGCWYESLIVHEYAHQWFGDMITCATWADIFLNEGFATWSEAFWYEGESGYNAYHSEITSNASYYLSNNPGWAISEPDWAVNTPPSNVLFNYAITYLKASCVLHQLRYVMGDSLFFAGLKAYATDTVNFKYQSAVIGDFRDKMEEVSGMDLDWYFDEWIYAPNHPQYNNTYYFESTGGGDWKVTFTANQLQTNTVFFTMPIEIRIAFSGGQDTLIRVMNDVNHQHYDWVFDKQPLSIQFDPDNEIVLKNASLLVAEDEQAASLAKPTVYQNEPNPFGSSTDIGYYLPERCNVTLAVYDVNGRLLTTLVKGEQEAGEHRVSFDAGQLAKGVYYYRFVAGDRVQSGKMVKGK